MHYSQRRYPEVRQIIWGQGLLDKNNWLIRLTNDEKICKN